jgi:uncharacterized protein YndB with AHSA1/START domain
MSTERRIEVEVEVAATPEQAWEAIATGPGITAWFMPTEVEGEVGGAVVHRPAPDMPSPGTITAYDVPHRFAYEEVAPSAGGEDAGRPIATEFLVEARAGGTCVVRVVMSGFGDDEAWQGAIDSFTKGWRQALTSLRLYLARFRGEPVASLSVGAVAPGPQQAAWEELTRALGVPAQPSAVERVSATAPGAPRVSGTVEAARDRMITLSLDEPARGIGVIGAGGMSDDEVFVTMRAQLFGPGATDVAAREQEHWAAWFADT